MLCLEIALIRRYLNSFDKFEILSDVLRKLGMLKLRLSLSALRDLSFNFRYYLMQHKHALTKFLRCVKWERESESLVALQLLDKWSPIDVTDALELLSPRFKNPTGNALQVR